MSRRSSRTVYVGNLPGDIREREVEDLFLKVETAHGGRGNSSSRDRYSSHSNGRGGRGVSRSSEYRVLVTGLPSSASWQDLLQNTFAANSAADLLQNFPGEFAVDFPGEFAADFAAKISCGFTCRNITHEGITWGYKSASGKSAGNTAISSSVRLGLAIYENGHILKDYQKN